MHACQQENARNLRWYIKHLQIRLEEAEYQALRKRAQEVFGNRERILQSAGKQAILAWSNPIDQDLFSDLTLEQRQSVRYFVDLLKYGGEVLKNQIVPRIDAFGTARMVKLSAPIAIKRKRSGS